MRLQYLHHRAEWLPEDFELPQRLEDATAEELFARSVHRSPERGLIGLKLGPADGAGIWDASGKLLLDLPHGGDVAFPSGGKEVLTLERGFGKCQSGGVAGLPNTVRRLELGSFRRLAETELCTPWGIGQSLVLDGSGTRGLVTWREQRQWGYLTIDVRQLKALPPRFEFHAATMSPPAFSKDGKQVLSCNPVRQIWWAEEGADWDDPSPGNAFKVSTITVHDLAADQVSKHDLLVTLPAGWRPDRPEDPDWHQVWGPEIVSDTQIRVWLPDGSEELLSLPLPARVEITRPLKTTRNETP